MRNIYKEIISHAVIIALFALLSIVYFYPTLENKVLIQHDVITAKGASAEVRKYLNENRSISWTNSMFSGMPTYNIGGVKNYGLANYLKYIFLFPNRTASNLFYYFLGFYILLICLGFDKFKSLLGAVAFGLSSYNIIIIVAGHIAKVRAIAFLPIVLAGFKMLLDKKYLWGFIVGTFGLTIQIFSTHLQIVYYTGLMIGLLFLFYYIWSIKDKTYWDVTKALGVGALVLVFSILMNFGLIWRNYEASKYSIRGKSEITIGKKNTKGLDKDYAFSWSLGLGETWSLLIPNVKGPESNVLGDYPKALENIDDRFKDDIAQQSSYWGDQPFTAGAVYFGAIIVFLAILGTIISKNKIKWWLLTVTILSIILAWGKNFSWFNNLMFDFFPLYNKFRSVTMTLVMGSVAVPILALLAIDELIKNKDTLSKFTKPLLLTTSIVLLILLIFAIFPNIFSFFSENEKSLITETLNKVPQNQKSLYQEFFNELEHARKNLFVADVWRSFIFILLSFITISLFWFFKAFNDKVLIGILAFLVFIDLWVIDRRFLNEEDFVSKRKYENMDEPNFVDKIILKDKDPHFRVLNLTTNPFTDSRTSLFHKNIGGYSAAKLQIYQDIIDFYLTNEIQLLSKSFSDSLMKPTDVLPKLQVLNMLNTKYIIIDPNQFPYPNPHSFGYAWFVDHFKFVENANDEILSIKDENLRRTAIINKNKFNINELKSIMPADDSIRSVKMTLYKPDRLEYEIQTKQESFVVFSDVYHHKWTATVNGQPTQIYRVNYILRGIKVPAGKSTVVMEFRPPEVFAAQKVEAASSFLFILLFLGLIFYQLKISKK